MQRRATGSGNPALFTPQLYREGTFKGTKIWETTFRGSIVSVARRQQRERAVLTPGARFDAVYRSRGAGLELPTISAARVWWVA